ncbi:MAG: phage holin family protein [Clostridia bacterium]|nr:phage holin family protein [Clostridia bacterium]
MNFNDYIKPEFLVLIPVLWFVGWAIKKSNVKNCIIPFILTLLSVVLCGIYTFATVDVSGIKDIMMCIFVSITQGVVATACAVFGDQIIKQAGELFSKNQNNNNNTVQK